MWLDIDEERHLHLVRSWTSFFGADTTLPVISMVSTLLYSLGIQVSFSEDNCGWLTFRDRDECYSCSLKLVQGIQNLGDWNTEPAFADLKVPC